MALDDPVYPVALVLSARPCLVVGGGRIAARKTAGLLESGAAVTVVAPETCPEIDGSDVRIERRPYREGEAADYFLVVAATGVSEVDALVYADCERARVLINAADDPAHCTFILPAVLRRGLVAVAVTTGGSAPALARAIRDEIDAVLGPETGPLADLLRVARLQIHRGGQSTEGLDWAGLISELRPLVAVAPDTAAAAIERWTVDALSHRSRASTRTN